MKNLLLLRREGLQLVILALPFVLAAVLWNKLPERIATHWDLHNQPNGWMLKAVGLLMPPMINVFVTALMVVLPRLIPNQHGNGFVSDQPGLRRANRTARLALSAFISLVCMAAAATAAGWRIDIGWVCSMAGLVFFAVLGNFCANLEPNHFIGIRTPWTLVDPATWRATHRLGSRVMVFGSLALLLSGFFVPGPMLTGLFVGFILLVAVGGFGYSAWFYRGHVAR